MLLSRDIDNFVFPVILKKYKSYSSYKKIQKSTIKDFAMAKKGNRLVIKLKSSESPHTYWTYKNKKNTTERLNIKKYDPVVRKHVMYKEEK